MTKRLLAGLTAATLVLASASAFAASTGTAPAGATAPQTQAAAAPMTTKTNKVALNNKKSCEKEWSVDHKAGKIKGVTQKDFMTKCLKGA
ncbi:hypothetical protein [Ancylobacter pratisalsi]|uniref:Phosphate starvation-inducible protein PsiF n=1 Tax=Ancylobacter pratisalsi TaxID=1745854 RepID=A0A6P1YG56_9HYPH|nr:hypothetical protein [Ancylobacter pratisalsi]QIB32298.1 hypothetical protein G3A50_00195 [Ancylobacter pratisalsi]